MTGQKMPLVIRPATTADIPAITRIYAHAVTHGTASFELEPPDEAEIALRMKAVLDGMGVDAGNGRNIGGNGRADGERHAPPRLSKRKRPGTMPGR